MCNKVKNVPYRLPRARPTSACVNPRVMRLCFSSLANCSSSSVERFSYKRNYIQINTCPLQDAKHMLKSTLHEIIIV